MKRILSLLFITCLIATVAEARMKDYSLSPEDSMNQPNISGKLPSNYDSYMQQQQQAPATGMGGVGQRNNYNGGYGSEAPGTPSNSFMTGFCDPNFRPLAGNSGLQACVEQHKTQSCAQFAQLPPDVQSVLDSSIGCAYLSQENGLGAANCSNENSLRLQTMKRYGNNQPVTNALIYMQDDILNASVNCVGGR